MQVLGELISLEEPDRLALPWWHRACLGFISKTCVYVVAVWNNADRPPDLIVTVFDPEQWKHLYRVMAQQQDRPGVLADHFQSVPPHNIAVAESVVIGNGTVYHNNMYIENRASQTDREFVDCLNTAFGHGPFFELAETPMAQRYLPRLQEPPSHGRITTFLSEFGTPPEKCRYLDYVQVQGGWLTVQWRERLLRFMSEEKISYDGFDLTKAVLSADTSSRILRFVFPRFGAKSVVVPHGDRPGEAGKICQLITQDGSNLLSATIRRIIAGQRAELVVVCEPPKSHKAEVNYGDELKTRLEPGYPGVKIRSGRQAKDIITPLQKFDRVITIPIDYQTPVAAHWKAVGKKTVFVSRRNKLQFHRDILDVIRSTLHAHKFNVLESNADATRERLTVRDVHTKLWASMAGIVIIGPVVSSDRKRGKGGRRKPPEGPLWVNVAHEIGHLQGQEKPLLFLVDEREEQPFARMPNLHGTHYQTYNTRTRRLGAEGEKEIRSFIEAWLKREFSEEMPAN
jgi:hypothetical protein